MQKIISLLLLLCFTITSAAAEFINKTIRDLNINKSAISVSIKDVENGNVVYALNQRMPMIPASTLKLVTSASALDTLGYDYKFSTKLYKSTNNDMYFKLVADPFLTSNDLEYLIEAAKAKNVLSPKNIYLDASIFDNVEWGEGWQWDDELNSLMPKFSAYNLDGNLLKIEFRPSANNTPPVITVKPFYPITFMNLVTTDLASKDDSVSLTRNSSIAPNVLEATGVISKTNVVKIPVNDTRRYFVLRLEDAIRTKKMDYYASIKNSLLPKNNVYLVAQVDHNIDDALLSILKTSNNFVAETLFKLAGGKFANSQGSIKNSLSMLEAYLRKLNISDKDIKVVDGSGVSKNNIMTADFMTDFLLAEAKTENFEMFKNYLPTPGEGTLKNRMLYFKNNLRAKTGTLSDTSSIAGYITSRKGKLYAFDIMINDAKTTSADKKNIEEQILRQVYMSY